MKVLFVAYSCSPAYGSEDAIGWNIPREFVEKGNEAFVITKSEHKEKIELWLKMHGEIEKRLHFTFVEIPNALKKIANGPLYSFRLTYFINESKSLIEKICQEHDVITVHQITPVEFRSIVDLTSNTAINYIVGPIAGAQRISKYLWKYLDKTVIEQTRMLVNNTVLSRKAYKSKVKRANHIFFANKETKAEFIKHGIVSENSIVLPEVGISCVNTRKVDFPLEKFTFLLVGRLIPIKGFEIVFDALKLMKNQECNIVICGDGPQKSKLQSLVNERGLAERVELIGFVSYLEMSDIYQHSNVLIMPSLREATGTVAVEAMLNGIPVITFDQFGASEIVNNDNGWLIELSKNWLTNLAEAMDEAVGNREKTSAKGKRAIDTIQKYTWNKKL